MLSGDEISAPREILFIFEGKHYACSLEAYDYDRIVLPDGRILRVDSWLESMPPQPQGLRVVDQLNAVVAHQI